MRCRGYTRMGDDVCLLLLNARGDRSRAINGSLHWGINSECRLDGLLIGALRMGLRIPLKSDDKRLGAVSPIRLFRSLLVCVIGVSGRCSLQGRPEHVTGLGWLEIRQGEV